MTATPTPLTGPCSAQAHNSPEVRPLRDILAAVKDGREWLAQTLCGLRGHAMMLQFQSTRLSLQCANCGRSTPGWVIGAGRIPRTGARS
jgi:hypothetical protein